MKEEKDMFFEQLDKEIEECWKEYAGSPKLSDEELVKIVRDVRKVIYNENERSKNALVVGEDYHFWLNDEDEIYDEKYGKQ